MAMLAAIGWIAGISSLTTFGIGDLAAHPLAVLGFALIAIVHLRTISGHDRHRLTILLLVAGIILMAQSRLVLGGDGVGGGFGDMPPGSMTAPVHGSPIRPTTVAELLMLVLALLPRTGTGHWQARAALMLATAVLIIGAVAMISTIGRIDLAPRPISIFAMPFPSTAMSLALSTSVIAWRYRDGWPAIFWTAPEESAGWSLLPLILILILIEFGFRMLADNGVLAPNLIDALNLVTNIGIIIAIVSGGARRLADRRRERDNLAGAIELAAVMVVDRNGIIQHWSRGCEELYGWPSEFAIGRYRRALLRTHEPDASGEMWGQPSATGRELVEYHRDGHRLLIDNHTKLLSRASDDASVVVVVTDVTDRRLAETALRASEARLLAAVEVQGLTIIEWNIVTRQVNWSTNVAAMCGASAITTIDDFILWADNVADAEDWTALRTDMRQAIQSGDLEFRRIVDVKRPPEGTSCFEMSARLTYEDSLPVRLILTCNDVTEHYRREEAIMVGEARLATAVAAQGLFIYEYDLLKDRPIWTTRGEDFLGLAPDADISDMPDRHWNRIPEIARQVGAAIGEAIAKGKERIHFSFEFQRLDGAHRYADSWARIIRDNDARPIRVIGTHLDITERHVREAALRASEAEMRAILATVPDAMIVCNETGVIRAFSATAEALFGYEAAAVIGHNILDLAVDDTAGRAAMRRTLFHMVHHATETSWPMSIVARRSNGEAVPISFVLGETEVEGQRMFVAFGRDMRPHIASEEKFHKLQNKLAQAARLGTMGEMAAALAHELSQPLTAIVNFLGAAELTMRADQSRADQSQDRLHQAIRSAGEQASRAGEIIRRLRAFISRGEADMRAEPVARLIRETAALALLNISSLGVRLVYDFEDEDRVILGDRIQIQQVLVNLIRNGVDAMTSSGCPRREMIISTKMQGEDFLEVEVCDTGPGIDPEILDTLFSPFATTKTEGLGFGLSICRRIIEAHGGQLSADTGAAGGAVFRFTLPVMDEEARRS